MQDPLSADDPNLKACDEPVLSHATKLIIAVAVFALGVPIGAAIAAWVMPPSASRSRTPSSARLCAIRAVGFRLIAASFQKETGTQFTLVPYRGNAPAVQDLAAGQIDLWFGGPDQLPLMQAGSIKAYAVTSDARMAVAPDIPTFGEMGLPALSFSQWVGLFAPKGTPRDIIGKLDAAAVDALADPVVRSRLAALGLEVFPRQRQTPEALGALVKADAEKWWPIIKEFGIKP